jgi:hypothetical protein
MNPLYLVISIIVANLLGFLGIIGRNSYSWTLHNLSKILLKLSVWILVISGLATIVLLFSGCAEYTKMHYLRVYAKEQAGCYIWNPEHKSWERPR